MTGVPRGPLTAWLDAMASEGYAVAKAPELWANLARGGDWDLVVLDLDRAEELLRHHVGPPHAVTRRSYVVSCHYSWGHVDLLPGLVWRAALLADAGDVVASAVRGEDGVVVASSAHQALAACVYPLLAHGAFRDRYRLLLLPDRPQDADDLTAALQRIFGIPGLRAENLPHLDPRRLRRRATLRALRSADGWARLARFARREIGVRSGALLARRGGGGARPAPHRSR